MNTEEQNEHQERHSAFASGLRKLADWVEANPTGFLPDTTLTIYSSTNKEEFAKVAKALKTFKKEYSDNYVTLKKEFGIINLAIVENREKVCERKVVGKRIVTEKKAVAFEDIQVEREIVEWHCIDSALLKE